MERERHAGRPQHRGRAGNEARLASACVERAVRTDLLLHGPEEVARLVLVRAIGDLGVEVLREVAIGEARRELLAEARLGGRPAEIDLALLAVGGVEHRARDYLM